MKRIFMLLIILILTLFIIGCGQSVTYKDCGDMDSEASQECVGMAFIKCEPAKAFMFTEGVKVDFIIEGEVGNDCKFRYLGDGVEALNCQVPIDDTGFSIFNVMTDPYLMRTHCKGPMVEAMG
ncbi:hypothetical protein ACFL1H_05370 [Nanoarchaeota archaeon]